MAQMKEQGNIDICTDITGYKYGIVITLNVDYRRQFCITRLNFCEFSKGIYLRYVKFRKFQC